MEQLLKFKKYYLNDSHMRAAKVKLSDRRYVYFMIEVVQISSSYSDIHIATIVRVGLFLSHKNGFSVEDISV